MAVPPDLYIYNGDDGEVMADKFNRGLGYVDTAGATVAGDAAAAANSAAQAVAAAGSAQQIALGVSTGLPTIRPSLLLDFTQPGLDPRLIATRTSSRTYWDRAGVLREAPPNVWPQEFDPVTGRAMGRGVWGVGENLLRWTKHWSKQESGTALLHGVTAEPSDPSAFKESTSTGEHFVERVFDVEAGDDYAVTLLADLPPPTRRLGLRLTTGFSDRQLTVARDGSFVINGPIYGEKVEMIPGGRVLISILSTASTTAAARARIQSINLSGDRPFPGDPSVTFRAHGFQAESGLFPSPLIPTEGSIGVRTADVNRFPLSGRILDKCTIVIDYIEPAVQGGVTIFQVDAGSNATRLNLRRSAAGELAFALTESGVSRAFVFGTPDAPPPGVISRVAMSMGSNKLSISINGGALRSSTQANPLSILSETLRLGVDAAIVEQPGCQFLRAAVYEGRDLTSHLQTLSAL